MTSAQSEPQRHGEHGGSTEVRIGIRRNHEDTKTPRNHEAANPLKGPQITQMNTDGIFRPVRGAPSSMISQIRGALRTPRRKANPPRKKRKAAHSSTLAETQRGSHWILLCGEVPGRAKTAGNCRAGKPSRKRALAPVSRHNNLRSRRAQASPPFFYFN